MSVQTERTTDDSDEGSSTDTSDADARTRITKDDAFHILQNSRRRAVLRYLLEHDSRASS
jgi:hypothetical protein